jgi:hypothetical protein
MEASAIFLMDMRSVLVPIDIFHGRLVYFGIFSRFGTLCQEKSGNPVLRPCVFFVATSTKLKAKLSRTLGSREKTI